MTRLTKNELYVDLIRIFDIFAITSSIILTSFKDLSLGLKDFVLVFILMITSYILTSNYSKFLLNSKGEIIKLTFVSGTKYTLISGMILLFVGTRIKYNYITTTSIILYCSVSELLILGSRIVLVLYHVLSSCFNNSFRYVYIAGTNHRAIQLAKKLENSGLFKVRGFIDKEWRNGRIEHIPLITDTNYLDLFRKEPIDEILICLPVKKEYPFIEEIIKVAEKQGILVRLSTNLFKLEYARLKIEYISGEPFLTFYTGNMYDKRELIIKRLLDIVISAFALIISLPLLLIIALLIKCTSKGPIFFVQERIGYNKRKFKMYKFRTMFEDAEERIKEVEHLNEMDGAAFKIKNDPRITPVGKFLRKFSLDELPQFFNVLKGDMSLVGPRPLPIRDYLKFEHDLHRRRFSVKPGLTCLWQVSGRNNLSFEQWMQLDNTYIDNWSLALDLKILLKTIPAVLFAKGSA